MSDLFVTKENNYNLRNSQALESLHKRTVKFGTESISYRGPQIWNLIPEKLRTSETLNKFKKEIKKWECYAYHLEYAKRTFKVLSLFTKNCNVFFSWTALL